MPEVPDVLIRPMRDDDVTAAERLSDEAFFALDSRTASPYGAPPARRSPERSGRWVERTRRLLHTDAGGCWVAEAGGELVGFATSVERERMWILVTFAVRPGRQGRGVGRQLLTAAAGHGNGCLRAMLSSSSDPQATRRYHAAGFALHPQMSMSGTVDRTALPVVTHVREGTAGDLDLLDSIDRRTRGAAHGPDHRFWLEHWRLLVVDDGTGAGYAFVGDGAGLEVLGATNRRTATRLLWAVLADGPAEQRLTHLTGANQWALDVGFAAGLHLDQRGYLALRGMDPPAPYVHNGALL